MKANELIVKTMAQYVGCKTNDVRQKFLGTVYNCITPLPRGLKYVSGTSWCAMSLSAVAQMEQFCDIIPVEQGCWEMMKGAQGMGIWKGKTYRPNVGDFVMFDYLKDDGKGNKKRDGVPDHVEIVEEIGENYITVIGGNNSGGICSRQTVLLSDENILGYVTPDYSKKGPVDPEPPEPVKPDHADAYDANLAGVYVVKTGLYLRKGPGTSYGALCVMPQGATVEADGWYTMVGSTRWLHVKFGTYEGFCSASYLLKR